MQTLESDFGETYCIVGFNNIHNDDDEDQLKNKEGTKNMWCCCCRVLLLCIWNGCQRSKPFLTKAKLRSQRGGSIRCVYVCACVVCDRPIGFTTLVPDGGKLIFKNKCKGRRIESVTKAMFFQNAKFIFGKIS